MFGGSCFMVNDTMCAAVKPERIMVRVIKDKSIEAIIKNGGGPMVHGEK